MISTCAVAAESDAASASNRATAMRRRPIGRSIGDGHGVPGVRGGPHQERDLAHRAFGLQSFHPAFDQLFAFGIDPLGSGLPADTPADWPRREEVERYKRRVREELEKQVAASGCTYLVCRLMFGGMSEAEATASIDRFAADVMPYLVKLSPR